MSQVAAQTGTWVTLPIDVFEVDHAYQRELGMTEVQRIAGDFWKQATGQITASKRKNGKVFVVDGQHRIAAMKLLGFTEVLVYLYEGLTRASEAALRLMLNAKRGEAARERFRAQLASGHPVATQITRIVNNQGGVIYMGGSDQKGTDSIQAIRCLEQIYSTDGGKTLARVLGIVGDCFGVLNTRTCQESVLAAVAWFLRVHPDANITTAKVAWASAGIDQLVENGDDLRFRTGQRRWRCFYLTLVDFFNQAAPKAQQVAPVTRGVTGARRGGRQLG